MIAISSIIGITNINGDRNMSNEEAEKMMDDFERWDQKHARHNFIARMERKLHHKEHRARS